MDYRWHTELDGTAAVQPDEAAPGDRPLGRALLAGAGGGVLATAATGLADRFLDRFISASQRRRERAVREGSPHEIAGPRFARRLVGRRLSRQETERARGGFSVIYGMVWGALYGLIRERVPVASRLAGLPFAVPFYLLCDGAIAPALRLTPALHRVPWQFDLKELANHVIWTATAEAVHRAAGTIRDERATA